MHYFLELYCGFHYLCGVNLFISLDIFIMEIGVLFDLDGVIIDSETKYSMFWSNIEEKYPTGVPDFSNKIKGTNLKSIMSHYTDESVKSHILKELEDYEKNMVYDIYPDAQIFLDELKSNKIRCAVVTSSSKQKMDKLFGQHPHLKGYFDAIVTGEMVKTSKPDPECFLRGAEMLNIPANQCVVFEDSIFGVNAGLDAGSKVVALTTTFPEKIKGTKADKIIDSFADFHLSDILSLF